MEQQSSFLRELEADDIQAELQNKIALFFEKSIMETHLSNYETLNNDLDHIRLDLYNIKEAIVDLNNKINPKIKEDNKTNKITVNKAKPLINSLLKNKILVTKSPIGSMKQANNIKNKPLSTNFNSTMNKSVISNLTTTNKTKGTRHSVDFSGKLYKSTVVK